MKMTVLPQDEIDQYVKIVEFILKNNGNGITVGDIKRKFNINEAEYEMAMDFCMPLIRNKNKINDYRTRHISFKSKVAAYVRYYTGEELAKKIRQALMEDSAHHYEVTGETEEEAENG